MLKLNLAPRVTSFALDYYQLLALISRLEDEVISYEHMVDINNDSYKDIYVVIQTLHSDELISLGKSLPKTYTGLSIQVIGCLLNR
jgi:hypothetical protein